MRPGAVTMVNLNFFLKVPSLSISRYRLSTKILPLVRLFQQLSYSWPSYLSSEGKDSIGTLGSSAYCLLGLSTQRLEIGIGHESW